MADNPYKYPDKVFYYEEHEQTDDVSDANADDINVVYAELENIETELGTNAKKGGVAALDGFSSVSKAIILKGSSLDRVAVGISYEAGQLFYQTDGASYWKAVLSGPGNTTGMWKEITAAGDPGIHVDKHQPGSTDPILTGNPSLLFCGGATYHGLAPLVSRSDHRHAIPANVVAGQVNTSSSGVGSSSNFARADHYHQQSEFCPTYAEKQGIEGITDYGPGPTQDGKFATKEYVDTSAASVAGLCLVAGNETIVSATYAEAPSLPGLIVKNHRLSITSTILAVSKIYVSCEMKSSAGTASVYVYIDGVSRMVLSTNQTDYTLVTDVWDFALDPPGLADNASYAVEIYIRPISVGEEAFLRTYEMYIR